MAKLIFHVTPHGGIGLNIGNFAISKAIRSLINQIDPNINILTIDAFTNKKLSGLNKQVIHEANLYSSGIIVGGGNLYENNELTVDTNALQSLQVPLVLFSISIGKIYNKNYKLVRRTDVMPDSTIKSLHEFSRFSLSRDKATYQHLNSLKVKNHKLGLCPTLFLNDYFEIPKNLSTIGKNDILLVIRNPELMNIPLESKPRVAKFIFDTYKKYKKQKKSIKIICNDTRDISFVNSLGINEYIYTGVVEEYLARLKNASLVISFRLHASLPCFSFGTNCINLSYDERSQSLMESIGLKNWDIPIFKYKNLDDITEKRINNVNSFESYSVNFHKNIKKYKKIQLDTLKIFK